MIISNYEIIQKIAETPHAAIYKVYRKGNPERLLALKMLKAASLPEYKKSQIRQKIEHLRILKDPLVITPLSLGEKDGNCFITQDYFEGIPLDKVQEVQGSKVQGSKVGTPKRGTLNGEPGPGNLERGTLVLKNFFTIACRLAGALEKVHAAGIIHGGIKPSNILVTPGTLDIRLIDFISALDVREVSHFIYDHCFVRGTLAYTSPEQTGRISHRIVFSSDLYSLGIVFYEMLTGQLPYYSDDPLELIHSHLAKEASGVHGVNSDVPTVLSEIIAKLMLKEPERRYRTSSGLLFDLVKAAEEYTATGVIREFPLEGRPYAQRAAFISRMFGRDREAGVILEEYEQVARGAFRSMFVSGLPGIGKTRLIQELQKPIVKHKGYFTSGKFDVYQKNIPYSSIAQALRNLIRTFLTESSERVALWKDKILATLGENGRLITDVIPELEVLIGPQPEVSHLPPVESLSRFHDIFDRFLACLASEENPLTLFIDDLQWCDAASFDFLAYLFANWREHPHLFVLGAYRHNEVDSSHPLTRLIGHVREGRWPLREIRLQPLKPQHCHEMVSYILDSPFPQTKDLSDFISILTEGNPLFVSESLGFLYNENLLSLDEHRVWRWDFEKIRRSNMPTTVVALFSSKIQKLPPALVVLLEYCACMGNLFLPAELAMIREMTLQETFETLRPALEQGLLTENKDQLQFIHDRVQEAALSGIPAERRRQIHGQIGKHLLAAVPKDTDDIEKLDSLFTIVAHLNLGSGVPGSGVHGSEVQRFRGSGQPLNGERGTFEPLNGEPRTAAYFLSDMNYHAGNKALDSLATEAANRYFNLSRELLPHDCWEDERYEQTFRIFQKAAKTELMCGNHENSDRLINQLLEHARTDLDRAECLAEQTVSLSSMGNFTRAIETANRGLAYFGKAIPDTLEEVERRREELMAEIASKDVDIREALLNMPFTRDRRKKVESAFYSELLADLYLSGQVPQMYLIAAQATLHCLSGGIDEGVIYAFVAMGIYFEEHEEFERSFPYEDLTRDLAAKYPNTFAATKCMNGVTWVMMHTRSHPRDIVEYSLRAFECGKSCGDINNAGIAYGPVMWNLQVQGADLPTIEDYAKECLQFSNRYHLPFVERLAEATQAGWVEPMKKDYRPAAMEGKLAQWEQDNHVASVGSYYIHKALAHYYFGEHEDAGKYLDRASKYLSGLSNNVLKREWHVFRVLNALRLYEKGVQDSGFIGSGGKTPNGESGMGNLERGTLNGGRALLDGVMAEIRPLVTKIEKWASFGPLFKPYLAFIYAELARVRWVQGFRVQRYKDSGRQEVSTSMR
ncbi:MAG: AAA family ATPase [Thermodesulfobacteriota bacterium]